MAGFKLDLPAFGDYLTSGDAGEDILAGGIFGVPGIFDAYTKRTEAEKMSAGLDAATGEGEGYQDDALALSQEAYSPYTEAGAEAVKLQADLTGANGEEAQAAAIAAIQNSPQFAAALAQGENSILANASATGGLRGGNTQAAMGQFSPMLLNQMIDQRYNQLDRLSGLGQASAAGVSASGQNYANNMSNLSMNQFETQSNIDMAHQAPGAVDIIFKLLGIATGTGGIPTGGGGGGF